MNKIIFIDNIEEFKLIDKKFKDIYKKSKIISLSNNFSYDEINELKKFNFDFIDNFLTNDDIIEISETIESNLFSWFIDVDTKIDLSSYQNLSLGFTFSSSIEIILNTTLRYYFSLSKIIKNNSEVYVNKRTEKIFIEALSIFNKNLSFKINYVDSKVELSKISHLNEKLELDPIGRNRDLNFVFKKNYFKEKIKNFICSLVNYLFKSKIHQNKVLIFNNAKLDNYLHPDRKTSNKIQYYIPFVLDSNIVNLKNNNKFYNFTYTSINYQKKLKKIIYNLNNNIKKKFNNNYNKLIIEIFSKLLYSHFSGAINYYNNSIKLLKKVNPKACIITGDSHEVFTILGVASTNLKIKNIFLPHGLYGWGYEETKVGRFKLFDIVLSMGSVDKENFLEENINTNNIVNIIHPYYSKFINIKKNVLKIHNFKKALILLPDYVNYSPAENIEKNFYYIINLTKILKKLDIEILGVKGRYTSTSEFRNANNKSLSVNGNNLKLYSGYSNFIDIVKEVDMVIGPPSTALIETFLMNKTYFCYQHCEFYNYSRSFKEGLYKYINCSFSYDILEKNILNNRPFKNEYSIEDIINLNKYESESNFYNEFETKLNELI